MGMGDNDGVKKKRKNPFAPIANYFKEVKGEMKKVVWPTFRQTVKNTGIVILFVLIVGVVIWALDLGFGQIKYTYIQREEVTQQQEDPSASPTELSEEEMLTMLGVTDEERAQYDAMTDEEKQAFLEEKINELQAQQTTDEGTSDTTDTGDSAEGGENPDAGSQTNGE